MSNYMMVNLKCKCCGKIFSTKINKGFWTKEPMDLDTNPHNPLAYMNTVICPHCGYSTDHYDREIDFDAQKIISSERYQKILLDETLDHNYKKIILAAIIYEESGDNRMAGYKYLMASWVNKDLNLDYIKELEFAINNFASYLEDNLDLSCAVTMIDCMRQAKQFDEAEETANFVLNYIDKEKLLKKILKRELFLIGWQDSKSYSISEV